MKRMLISTDELGETRVALVKDGLLYDLEIETKNSGLKKANIYKGRISRIEPSLDAVFVDYGAEKHGFLPFKEIDHQYFQNKNSKELVNNLFVGQELIVQVDKDERGNKGAALTTFISLAGSYLVLMPNNPKVGGISRQIEGEDREELKNILQMLEVPKGCGVIIRTAGLGRSSGEIKRDLHSLLMRWDALKELAEQQSAPSLLYQEENAAMRAVRDYLRQEIEEIWVDKEDLFYKIKEYVGKTKTDFVNKVKYYRGTSSLFCNYRIEHQIESAFHRVVKLPSGGSISIDLTEALVSIDVNSAKATSGSDIEETALHTNLEAAEEIARQLRIRDLGGLIVIDFIDMSLLKNQKEVCKRLKEALDFDRARVKMGAITRFGLLEMSRQRLRSCLSSLDQTVCPRCGGNGSIRTVFPVAASILRILEEEIYRQKEGEIQLYVPLEVATYLFNEQRVVLNKIINAAQIKITVIPDINLSLPKFLIKKVKKEEGETLKLLANRKEAHDNGLPIVVEGKFNSEVSKEEEIKIIRTSLFNDLKNCLRKIKNYLFNRKKKIDNKGNFDDTKNSKQKNIIDKKKKKESNKSKEDRLSIRSSSGEIVKKGKFSAKNNQKNTSKKVVRPVIKKVEIKSDTISNNERKLDVKAEVVKEKENILLSTNVKSKTENNFYRTRKVVEKESVKPEEINKDVSAKLDNDQNSSSYADKIEEVTFIGKEKLETKGDDLGIMSADLFKSKDN